jgi:hypothetical protein
MAMPPKNNKNHMQVSLVYGRCSSDDKYHGNIIHLKAKECNSKIPFEKHAVLLPVY